MFYDYYNNDPYDNTVHYRLYKSIQDENEIVVACLQNFDYPDYYAENFIDTNFYLYEEEAERQALIENNPDTYIPALNETHYRVYEVDNQPTVLEIIIDDDYKDYDEDKFLTDEYYKTYDEADIVAFYINA